MASQAVTEARKRRERYYTNPETVQHTPARTAVPTPASANTDAVAWAIKNQGKPTPAQVDAAAQATMNQNRDTQAGTLVERATGIHDNAGRMADRRNNRIRASVDTSKYDSRLNELYAQLDATPATYDLNDSTRYNLMQEIREQEKQKEAFQKGEFERLKAEDWEKRQAASIDRTGDANLPADLARLHQLEAELHTAAKQSMNSPGASIRMNEAQAEYNALLKELQGKYGENLDGWQNYVSRMSNKEEAQKMQEDLSAKAKENPFWMSAATLPINMGSGLGFIDVAGQKAQRMLTGSDVPIDYNTPGMRPAQFTNAVRGSVSEKIEDDTAGKLGSDTALGNLYSGAYNLGMSMGDSVIGALTGSSVFMAGSAATNAMLEAKERGATDTQALLYGLSTGAMEGVMEKLSIDSLLSMDDPKTAKQLFLGVLKQGGVEASEEFNTNLANTLADAVIMGDKSQLNTSKNYYIQQGYSPEEAEKLAKQEWGKSLAMDAIGGFISGGLFETAKGVSGYIGNRISDNSQNTNAPGEDMVAQMAQDLMGNKNTPAVEAEAESTSVNTDPVQHTPQEQAVIEDYQNAVDEGMVQFAQGVANGSVAPKSRYQLKPVSNRAADDILRITGVDTHGFSTVIEGRMVDHIIKRHGESGTADRSMQDVNDLGRIQYIIDNYDSVSDAGTSKAYTTNKANGKPGNAKTVVFEKAVNGTYYVVEAVPDTKAKTTFVVSAYMAKNGHKKTGAEQLTDVSYDTPVFTPESGFAQTPESSIPTNTENVNGSMGDMGAKASDFKHEVKKSQSHSIENREDLFHVPEDQRTEFQHDVVTEKESLHNARLGLDLDYEGEKAQLIRDTTWTGEQVDKSRMISDDLLSKAQETGTEEAWQEYRDWRKVMKQHDTELARGLQALAKYARKTGSKIVELASDALETARPGTDHVDVLNTVADYAEQYDAAVGKKDVDSLVQIIKNTSVTRRTGTFRKNNLPKEIIWALDRIAELAKADLAKSKEAKVQQEKPKPVQNYTLKSGDRVTVSDRNNIGTITEVNTDGTYTVHFKAKSGAEATKSFPADMVTKLGENKPAVSIPGNNYEVGRFYDFLENFAAAGIEAIATDKQKASFVERAKTFRYNAMLSKAATVLRNLVGNGIFDPADSVSRDISVILDMAISKKTGTRSVAVDKSVFSKAKRTGSVDALAMALLETGLDVNSDGAGSKYGRSANRTNKMTGGAFERLMSSWEKWTAYALTATDEFAKGGIASEVQRGIDQLYEQGRIKDDSLRDAGQQEAKYRTFQDETMLSNALKSLRDAGNKIHLGEAGLGDVALPFAQVPANLASRALEYSPAGLAKSVVDLAVVLKKAENGTLTAAEQAKAVQGIGRGINGSAMIGIAAALALKGVIHVENPGDTDENKDKAAMDKASGLSGTQWNLSAAERWANGEDTAYQDGDIMLSIGFLDPINAMLVTGALIAEDVQTGDATIGSVLKDSLSGTLQAVGDLPVMQTFQNVGDAFRYSDEDTFGEKVIDAGLQFAADQTASFIPNAVKGIAQGLDPYQRDLYTGDTLGEKTLDAWKASIPGLRNTLPVKYDSFGNPMMNEEGVQNFLNTNILPGQVTTYKTNDTIEQMRDLEERTGKASVYPGRKAPNSVTVSNETIPLTQEQKAQFQQDRGKLEEANRTALFANPNYEALTDEMELKAQSYAEDFANQMAKANLGIGYEPDRWVSELANASPREIGEAMVQRAVESIAESKAYDNKYDGLSDLLEDGTINDQVALAAMSETAVDGYMGYCKNAGISVQQYTDVYGYMNRVDDLSKTLQYIDQMGMSKSQRVAMAQAIHAANPKILVLDNPVSQDWLLEQGATDAIVDQFSFSQRKLYRDYIKGTDIEMGDYLDIYNYRYDGHKQDEVIAEIDKLGYSNADKINLFLAMDYSAKKIPNWWK